MTTEFVCIDDTQITLTAGSIWGWGISVPTTTPLPIDGVNTFYGNTKTITVSGTGIKLTVNGDSVILRTDILLEMAGIVSAYHSTTAGLWSNNTTTTAVGGLDGTLMFGDITSGLIPSTKLRHNTDGVILENLSGNFSILHVIPTGLLGAILPSSPIPDVVPIYTGTWEITNNGGNTIFKSAQ